MYCPKCGKENQDGAEFCAGCGGILGNLKKTFDFKAFFAKYKYAVIAVTIVLVLVVVASGKDSPEKTVKKFMNAMKNCDAATIVDLIYIDNDTIKESGKSKSKLKRELKEYLEDELEEDGCGPSVKYKIISSKVDGKEAIVKIKATYEGESNTIELSLIKSSSKWYVDPEDLF